MLCSYETSTRAREPGPRALVWLLGVEAVAIGALDVLYVVLAIGTLHHGGSTVGYLNAAFDGGCTCFVYQGGLHPMN